MEGRILKLPLGKGNKLKERSWRLTKGEGSLLGWGKEKGREKMWKKKKISSYVWKGVVHGEMCARIKNGRMSMTKPLEFYFK